MSPDAWVSLGLAILGGVVWLVRLEGKVKGIERESAALQTALDAIQKSHNDLSVRIVEQLGNIRESLARLEERMGRGRQ